MSAVPVRLPLRDDVEGRVEELLRNVTAGCERHPGENYNQSNKRHAEAFLEYVEREFRGRCQARFVLGPSVQGHQESAAGEWSCGAGLGRGHEENRDPAEADHVLGDGTKQPCRSPSRP